MTTPTPCRVCDRALVRAALVTLVAGLGAAPVTAQSPETGAFTIRQHGQVIATERFERTAEALHTELTIMNQATFRAQGTLRPDATIARLEVRVYGPGGVTGEPVQSSAVTFENGVASFEQPLGTSAGEPKEVASGVVAYINPSAAFMEQILRRARVVSGDSVTVPVWSPAPGGGQVTSATIIFGAGTATLTMAGVAIEATTDDAGRLLSALIPSQQVEIARD